MKTYYSVKMQIRSDLLQKSYLHCRNVSINCNIFSPYASGVTTFVTTISSLISCKIIHFSMCEMAVFVSNVQVCFTWLLWKWKTRAVPAHWQKVPALLCREMGREKIFFFSLLRFSHWVTQFHAPLAYLGWRAMKSVQFWDFRGTVFWNPLRYVAILLSPPLDRLRYYVTVAKVKLGWWYVPSIDKLVSNSTQDRNYWTNHKWFR